MFTTSIMAFIDLPTEILTSILNNVANIEDFTSLSSTCSLLRELSCSTTPEQIIHLADASAPTFFQPHPWFLTAMTVRSAIEQIKDNAVRDTELVKAIEGGPGGLYQFCLRNGRLDLCTIRKWHLARFHTIHPLDNKIDQMAGHQWYETPNFFDGGVSEPSTPYTNSSTAVYQIILYAEMFGPSMEKFLRPELETTPFDIRIRLKFLIWISAVLEPPEGKTCRDMPLIPQFVRGTGQKFMIPWATGVLHTLSCSRWERLWDPVIDLAGGFLGPIEPAGTSRIPTGSYRRREIPDNQRMGFSWQDDFRSSEHRRNNILFSAVMIIGGLDAITRVMKTARGIRLTQQEIEELRHIRTCVKALDLAAQDGLSPCRTWDNEEVRGLLPNVPHMHFELRAAYKAELEHAIVRW